ncbi:ribonuclease HII [Fredinandcohnia humi]
MSQLTIKEIENLLGIIHDEQHELIEKWKRDERKGVQLLLQRWNRQREEKKALEQQFIEMTKYEQSLYEKGVKLIAGVDEVGRGPLAGPVVAAAVILPIDFYLPGLNDSKKLTELKREELFNQIKEKAVSIGIGIISANIIDEVNIYEATKQAMKKAILALSCSPEHVLVDAIQIPIDLPQTSIIKGDAKSISIAASSIIAKVTRDRLMTRLGLDYPQYGFEKHMGYGTPYHMEALKQHGVTNEHRKSFGPVRDLVVNKGS